MDRTNDFAFKIATANGTGSASANGLMMNIAYAGALAALLGMDTDIIRALLEEKFGRKPALMASNRKAIDLGFDYAKAQFDCPLPIHLDPMDATREAILIDGNTAAAL